MDLNINNDEKKQKKLPPLALERGVLCPFNSQATLFYREAFHLLLIPSTTAMRVSDIWRGYFSQRLLWEMGSQLTFDNAEVRRRRTSLTQSPLNPVCV